MINVREENGLPFTSAHEPKTSIQLYIDKSIPNGTLNGSLQRVLAGPRSSQGANSHAMTPAFLLWLSTLGPLSPNFFLVQGDIFFTPSPSQRRDGNFWGGKGKKGKNFSADEERALCKQSFDEDR